MAQVRVHGGSRIDCFMMACIFTEVEFVRYVLNIRTVGYVGLELY